ncbi:MAG: alkaline phosphatase family protein, partial [Candidatus Marinimicrobia bacterium]|nr:alkaline phosphatase family protein [Candidatus Neomarinimicrobiota bacterium]
HGTPYDYDTHVPLYFSHVTFSPAKSDDHVATVDIAPTIAKILGVVPDSADGKVLRLGERVKR